MPAGRLPVVSRALLVAGIVLVAAGVLAIVVVGVDAAFNTYCPRA